MVSDTADCRIIGEVAQAHDGSLGAAHAYIDAIAKAGATAVKFQTHIAEAESTVHEPWRVRFSYQDSSRFEYWKRMEFTEDQWIGLKRHSEERGLVFLSSPFSIEAAEMLMRIGVQQWKIPSGETINCQLLDFLIATRLPLILSTGMSRIEEIDNAVARVQKAGNPLTVLQCTSIYPCPPEKIGLNMIPYYRQRYGCSVGLSDHSGTIYPGLAAAALGVQAIEVHVTFSRECFGPDVSSSITTQELAALVDGVRFIQKMRSSVVDKDEMAAKLGETRDIFTKSIVVQKNLPSGTILSSECLAARKPGTGIPSDRLPSLIGRRLRRAVAAGEMLQEADLS